MPAIHIEQGDLTTYKVDAIVNAANSDLILGGGVAGTIARKGGPVVQQECNAVGPIKIGQAAMTSGGHLPARYVIHAASMDLGGRTTADNLAKSVRAALVIADAHKLRSIAFPAIGTGIAGFPFEPCAEIMIKIFLEYLQGPTSLENIFLVLWTTDGYNVFQRVFNRMSQQGKNPEKFEK